MFLNFVNIVFTVLNDFTSIDYIFPENLKIKCISNNKNFSEHYFLHRAIFRWLTVKDLNKLTFEDSLDPESPMAQLHQIKQGLESYHNLFKRLCRYFVSI